MRLTSTCAFVFVWCVRTLKMLLPLLQSHDTVALFIPFCYDTPHHLLRFMVTSLNNYLYNSTFDLFDGHLLIS